MHDLVKALREQLGKPPPGTRDFAGVLPVVTLDSGVLAGRDIVYLNEAALKKIVELLRAKE